MSTILVDGDYVVDASQNLTFTATSEVPVYTLDGTSSPPDPTFTDKGSITVSSADADAFVQALADNGGGSYLNSLVKIAAGASLSVSATGAGSSAYGYGWNVAFENDGAFTVSAVHSAVGANADSSNAYAQYPGFNNTGVFSVSAAAAKGVQSGSLNDGLNSGTLAVAGITSATGIDMGVLEQGASLANSGVITATASAGTAYGITISGLDVVVAITNTGTITAQHAIYESNAFSPPQTPILHLTNSGTINGDIALASGPAIWTGGPGQSAGAQIHNTGAINGAIHLDANGNDLYDGRGGTQTGGLYLGGGTDTVYLGDDGEIVHAGSGSAVVTGGAGGDAYVFDPSVASNLEITNLSPAQGDKIDLSAFSRFASLADVIGAATQAGANTVISIGPGSLTLDNVQKASLTAADFKLFAPAPSHGLQINVTDDPSVSSAPAGFEAAVQTAVQFFESTFNSDVTINIHVGWGELEGQPIDDGAIAESSFGVESFTYLQVREALLTHADLGSAAAQIAMAGLPASGPAASLILTTAEAKVLGLDAGTPSSVDGHVGLSSADTFTFDPNQRAVPLAFDAIGAIEHEISEVLGRVAFVGAQGDYGPLDLFRYSSSNVHDYQPGSAFFSPDGVTQFKALNNGSAGGDDGDWAASIQADAYDASGQSGVEADVSSIDDTVMELLGYHLSSVVPGGPTVGPGLGGTPVLSPVTGGALNGASGSDWLEGQAGADTLHGGPGSDYIDGGGGLNTAAYDGSYRQYAVTIGSPTTAVGGPEGGTDVLVDIQRIQFVDGYLAYSPTDTAGQVYRLYEATLARAPDQAGLTNWTNQLNAGASLQGVAGGFVGSTEFQNVYGNLSNTDFVTLLYNNVLHRQPDQAGETNWVNMLNSGQDTRAQVVLGFSESPEDINDLAPSVQQGLWIGNADAAEVARLYDTMFSRLPDTSGLSNWTHSLETGTSLQAVANGFVGSTEFQNVYGNLSNTDYVTLLYNNVLHRPPDQAGETNWVNMLNSGQDSRAQVAIGFSESPEHIANMAPYIDNGVWLAR